MHPNSINEVPNWILKVLNNICDIERKIRPVAYRPEFTLEAEKIFYEDPMGELFTETRTDLEASITGVGTENLHVVEVIKPIVRIGDKNFSRVIQKGIVVVESRVEGEA